MLAALGCDDLLASMDLAVQESGLNRTGKTLFGSVFVDFVAFASEAVSEVFLESAVGLDDVEIPVLDGNVTGHFLEYLLVAGLAFPELFLKNFDLGDVGGHLEDRSYLAVFIADWGGVNDYRHVLAVESPDSFLAAVVQTVSESTIHGTHFAPFRTMLVYLIAIAAFEVSEVPAEPVVGLDYLEIPVLNRQVARQRFEVLAVW